jgi:hypothetical protein
MLLAELERRLGCASQGSNALSEVGSTDRAVSCALSRIIQAMPAGQFCRRNGIPGLLGFHRQVLVDNAVERAGSHGEAQGSRQARPALVQAHSMRLRQQLEPAKSNTSGCDAADARLE